MTALLQQTIERAEQLPPTVQDALAARWLAELEADSWTADPVPAELAKLLARITPETLHAEVEAGPARGNEAW